LGALFQGTPYSAKQGKVVELPGGAQASTSKDISNIGGWDLLDNNQVKFFSPPPGHLFVIPRLTFGPGEFCNDLHYEHFLDGTICYLEFLNFRYPYPKSFNFTQDIVQ
jgi:hypothetical protein